MRILIILLALCVWVFADVPNGTGFTQTVTINSAYVSETSTDFLLQFKVPRTGDVLASCTSAANIAMTNLNDTLRRARWIVYTADTLYIYAHGATSTSANTVYRLHYGLTLNEVNTSSAFTNCGIAAYWGLNETSGTTTNDYLNTYNGTISNSTVGTATSFCRGITMDQATSSIEFGTCAALTNVSTFTINLIFTPLSYTSGINVLLSQFYSASHAISIRRYTTGLCSALLTNGEASKGIEFYFTNVNDKKVMLSIVYNGANAESLKLLPYVNGTVINTTVYGPIPTTTTAQTSPLVIGYSSLGNALTQIADEASISTVPSTAAGLLTKYNMLFNPSTFWTLGTPVPVPDILDTITLTCTATGYDSLRWFLNGNPTDSTGLTYTILADSAWYASKSVYYVMAYNIGGSTKSGEWVFGIWGALQSRWNAFKSAFKSAYKPAWK